MEHALDFSTAAWLNPPKAFRLEGGSLEWATEPGTDFWQRTYYGFRNDNAHAFLFPLDQEEFTFQVQAAWEPQKMFDQAGVALYQDCENWFKASVEFDNPDFARLGSVVTNLGYSDWATTDVPSGLRRMAYRVSRRGQDFLIENAEEGQPFRQMRIFHLQRAVGRVHIGVYACSPLESSMRAAFSSFRLGACSWQAHSAP